ncbi:MAG: hypothetical protein V4598_04690 [Bdellovibrionota bacterium]
MPFLSLSQRWGDQFNVSEFAMAAHQGDFPTLEKLLSNDPELTKDTMALYLAIRAGRKDVFSWLIQNKHFIRDTFYTYIMYYDADFLELLPPNEEAMNLAHARQVSLQLADGLISGKLTLEDVRKLIYAGADATRGIFIAKDSIDYFPIHLATLHPNLAIFKEIVRAGGDPKTDAPDGKNACRMIYEHPTLTREKRKAFHKYFKQTNVSALPPLSLKEKIRLSFGLAI